MVAQEAYFADNERYTASIISFDSDGYTEVALPSFSKVSDGVRIGAFTTDFANNDSSWAASTYHLSGGKTYCYDSASDSSIYSVDGIMAGC